MNASFERRINIASCWAASRIALLDSAERYEDSYSINQEFCEWTTGLGNNSTELEKSILKVPNFIRQNNEKKAYDLDELLEL